MFMNDYQVEQVHAEFYADEALTAEVINEVTAYESLLNTVEAARAGLASGEHDYDVSEEDII